MICIIAIVGGCIWWYKTATTSQDDVSNENQTEISGDKNTNNSGGEISSEPRKLSKS